MDIQRRVADCLADGCMHRDLQIADRVDAVGAEVFQELYGCRVAMAEVSGALEHDVLRKVAVLTHFVGNPKHAFVINQEAAAAEFIAALDVFDRANELFLAAETIADSYALGRQNRCAGIIGGAGAGGEHQFATVLIAKLAVLL